jgi:hypothetical protein
MVPQGVKAVALLFPCVGTIAAKRTEEDTKIRTSGQEPIDPGVFWMKQTVRLIIPASRLRLTSIIGRFRTPVERWV